ncbi:MAG: RnfABCDGE type electron transport complex subunit D [Planctomycetota bacterium]
MTDTPNETKKKAPEPRRFLTAASPHIRAEDDIPRIMWTVVVALMPALFAGVWFFRGAAARIIAVAVIGAVLTEAVIQLLTRRKMTIGDGSAVVTGLLVAFVMPSNAPWFVPLAASVFAIAVVKLAFGGLGCNIWNPALAGRAFAVACFAGLTIGGWGANWVDVRPEQRYGDGYTRADTMTGASALSARKDYGKSLPKLDVISKLTAKTVALFGKTPRETLKKIQAQNTTPLLDMFLGAQVGCIGETSALAIIVGGLILLGRKVIRWYIPVAFIGTVALLGWLLPVQVCAVDGGKAVAGWVWCGGEPLFEILAGGVMLGAVFMATDMVTSPLSRAGRLVFGIGCGALTVVIRKYGGYPEGVCYSILLMNTATPLIDAFTKPRVYGKKK